MNASTEYPTQPITQHNIVQLSEAVTKLKIIRAILTSSAREKVSRPIYISDDRNHKLVIDTMLPLDKEFARQWLSIIETRLVQYLTSHGIQLDDEDTSVSEVSVATKTYPKRLKSNKVYHDPEDIFED